MFFYHMYLELKKLDKNILNKSLGFFSNDYINLLKFKPFFEESIVARYLMSRLVEKNFWYRNYYPEGASDWLPVYNDNIYWSISHKKWLVFIWVSDKKLWIDIEVYKNRDISLLNKFSEEEYNILWWKNWDNFYKLWGANEAIIKYNQEKNYKDWMYKLVNKKEKIQTISSIDFNLEFIFSDYKKEYKVFSWIDWDLIYAICC